ncbi:MAG TPA: TIR domain-containing protein [Caulobacteraceae bacterium]|jgi:adenylate cyclase
MADLFVSYARVDRARVAPLVAALEGEGWSVWWDPEMSPGQEFDRLIGEELDKARAVIAVWTPASVASRWVRGEARVAADRGVLAPVRFEAAQLPIDLRAIHTTDLDDWREDAQSPAFRELARAIRSLLGETGAAGRDRAPRAAPKLSICVLPFSNLSGDPEQEYFSDGISEDIITDLSKVSALAVTARNNAFTFKGKSIEVQQVARHLNVSHVLEGSVRKAGNRVRITAQLINGETGNHLWAERWDRDLTDIFAVQDEISQAVVAALKLKLLPEEKKAIERRGTENVEAYELFLMARRYYLGQSAKRRDLVVRLCQRAIDLDPDYARAWALLAAVQAGKAAYSSEASDAGWAAAERALALDPGLAEAHAAKGLLLTRQARYDEAHEEIEISLRLDPESNEVNRDAGLWAIATRRYEDAIRYWGVAIAADEADYSSPFMAMQCHEALGDKDGARTAAKEAVARLEKALVFEPDNGALLAFGAGALATLGEIDRAKGWANHALLLDPDDGTLRYNLACAMIRAGDTDYALDRLEEAMSMWGQKNFVWAQTDNDLDPIRELPRYKAIMSAAETRFAETRIQDEEKPAA